MHSPISMAARRADALMLIQALRFLADIHTPMHTYVYEQTNDDIYSHNTCTTFTVCDIHVLAGHTVP